MYVGYTFFEGLFADVGFSLLSRNVVLEGEESGLSRGELNDTHTMFKLGLGYSL